jgi:hypothetical protein
MRQQQHDLVLRTLRPKLSDHHHVSCHIKSTTQWRTLPH